MQEAPDRNYFCEIRQITGQYRIFNAQSTFERVWAQKLRVKIVYD